MMGTNRLPDGYLPIRVVPKRKPGILRGRKRERLPAVESTITESHEETQTPEETVTEWRQIAVPVSAEVLKGKSKDGQRYVKKTYVMKNVPLESKNANKQVYHQPHGMENFKGIKERVVVMGEKGGEEHVIVGEDEAHLGGPLIVAPTEKIIDCPICGDIFQSRDAYEEHDMIYHGAKNQCEACGKLLPDSYTLRRHIRVSKCGKLLQRIDSKRFGGTAPNYETESSLIESYESPPMLEPEPPVEETEIHVDDSNQNVVTRTLSFTGGGDITLESGAEITGDENIIFVDADEGMEPAEVVVASEEDLRNYQYHYVDVVTDEQVVVTDAPTSSSQQLQYHQVGNSQAGLYYSHPHPEDRDGNVIVTTPDTTTHVVYSGAQTIPVTYAVEDNAGVATSSSVRFTVQSSNGVAAPSSVVYTGAHVGATGDDIAEQLVPVPPQQRRNRNSRGRNSNSDSRQTHQAAQEDEIARATRTLCEDMSGP